MRLLCLPLLLSGCWKLRTPAMKEALELQATGSAEAENQWISALDGELTFGEWSLARDRICALRLQRLQPVVAALNPAGVSYSQAAELHEELRFCHETGGLDADVVLLEERTAAAALQPLHELPRSQALEQAHPHMGHLRADHEEWAWFSTLRQEQADHLLALADGAPPATAHRYRQLAARYVEADEPPKPHKALARLASHLDAIELQTDESCAHLSEWRPPEGRGGVAYQLNITLSDCSSSTHTGEFDETYVETEYRTESQEVTHVDTTRITTYTPVTNYNCWTSLNYGGQVCDRVGSSHKYDTVETSNEWTEWVDVQVPYEVEKQRRVTRATRHVHVSLGALLSSPDGKARFIPTDVSTSTVGSSSVNASQAVAPTLGQALFDTRDKLSKTVSEWGAARATSLRLAALMAEGADRTDPVAAREALLVAALGGQHLTEAQWQFVAAPTGLPATRVADMATLPSLGGLEAMDTAFHTFAYRRPALNSTVRDGFPPLIAGVGYGRVQGAELQEQPTRTGSGVTINVDANYSGTIGPGTRGVGLHFAPSLGIFFGKRTNEDYVFPQNDVGYPNLEEEPTSSVGYRLGLGTYLGGRIRYGALFVGVRPQFAGQAIGFYNAAGFALPLSLYAEIRVLERYPILLYGWGVDLASDKARVRGASAFFPVYENTFLYARTDARMLRTQVKGITDYDDVDAGLQPINVTTVGLSFGF
jgi:hypothetical protein